MIDFSLLMIDNTLLLSMLVPMLVWQFFLR